MSRCSSCRNDPVKPFSPSSRNTGGRREGLDRIVPTTAAAAHGASEGIGPAGGRTGAGNSSLASAERGQLQAGQGSRHWTDHGERAGGLGGRCEELRKRPTDGGLVGVGSPTALERRQTDASGNQQTRRFLSAYA